MCAGSDASMEPAGARPVSLRVAAGTPQPAAGTPQPAAGTP